jgi:cyclohexadienyl dehydratase
MFRAFIGLASALLLTVSAQAQQAPITSRLDDIIKRGTLRVGMTGDYLPFTYLDKATSEFRGFDVDMAEALARRSASRSSLSGPRGRN